MAWDAREVELVVVHLLIGPSDPITVYRAVAGPHPGPDDFRSPYERGYPPPRRIQNDSTPIWMSISTMLSAEAVSSRIALFPKIGTHVAELELRPGRGFAFAETMEPNHISVWGDPHKLDASVTNVYPAI